MFRSMGGGGLTKRSYLTRERFKYSLQWKRFVRERALFRLQLITFRAERFFMDRISTEGVEKKATLFNRYFHVML